MHDGLRKELNKSMMNILILFFLVIILSFFMAKSITKRLRTNLSIFIDHISSVTGELDELDADEFMFYDFSELATATNSMSSRLNKVIVKDELTGLYNRRYIMKKMKETTKQGET